MAYSIPNFWSQNTGFHNQLAQNQERYQNRVADEREAKRQQRIYKQRADQKFLETLTEEFNAADQLKAEFEDYAVNAREEMLDYMAKAMTYDLDENGEVTDKRKVQRLFSEPGLSDREMLLIRKKMDGYVKAMDEMKGAETQLREGIEKFDADKHDYDAFMTARSEIEGSGKPSKYPLLVLKDKDPSFLRGLKGKETGKSTVKGDGVTTSKRNRTGEDERLFIYRDALINDAAFQKYSVSEMLQDMENPEGFVSGMNEADIRVDRPTDFLLAYGVTGDDLREFENSYGGIIPPSLVQAAMTYGEKVKKYQDNVDSLDIGANVTYGGDGSEGNNDGKEKTQRYDIDGMSLMGVDLSQQEKTSLHNYRLPAGAYTMDGNDVKNPEITQVEQQMKSMSRGEKRKAKKQIQSLPSTIKSNPRKISVKDRSGVGDYEVVTYSEGDNVIVLKQYDKNTQKDEFTFIPFTGNEDVIQNIIKGLDVDKKKKKTIW